MRRQHRYLALAAVVAMACPAWSHEAAEHRALSTAPYATPVPGTYSLANLGTAPDGQVLTSSGESVRLAALIDGRLALLSFIYTHCSDADGCPVATAVLARVQKEVAGRPQLTDRVTLLSLSFDPARDTPEVMARYGAPFAGAHVPWLFLTTGGRDALTPLLTAFGQHVREDWSPVTRSFSALSHLLRVFLIDAAGNIRNIYGATTFRAEAVVADLETLARETSTPPPPAPERDAASTPRAFDLVAHAGTPALGLPPIDVPAINPMTREKVALGRRLFFDRRLSHNDTVSCGMCHLPRHAFTNNDLATSVGIEGRSGRRNAPSLLNVAYRRHLFADGRETALEQQVWKPLLAHEEMANPAVGFLLAKLRNTDDYEARFEEAFPGRGLSMETLGMAIASYERCLIAGDSPFDRWRFGGEEGAISAIAQRGFALFVGEAGCASCHSVAADHALFTDHQFHNTGIGYARVTEKRPSTRSVQVTPDRFLDVPQAVIRSVSGTVKNDLGRYEVTLDPSDRYRYHTPSLRNVALTAPYMHDGSLGTLEEVIAFYDRGGVENPLLDARIRPLSLGADEIEALVEFLRTLTGSDVDSVMADGARQEIGE
ncbi:MAG: photosynthetic protein synthase I, partial [Myxococcales bacterium]|nr:photosynthetic protein synthase I [Myxococcales bacterium]